MSIMEKDKKVGYEKRVENKEYVQVDIPKIDVIDLTIKKVEHEDNIMNSRLILMSVVQIALFWVVLYVVNNDLEKYGALQILLCLIGIISSAAMGFYFLRNIEFFIKVKKILWSFNDDVLRQKDKNPEQISVYNKYLADNGFLLVLGNTYNSKKFFIELTSPWVIIPLVFFDSWILFLCSSSPVLMVFLSILVTLMWIVLILAYIDNYSNDNNKFINPSKRFIQNHAEVLRKFAQKWSQKVKDKKISLPKMSIPKISIPKVSIPKISMPKIMKKEKNEEIKEEIKEVKEEKIEKISGISEQIKPDNVNQDSGKNNVSKNTSNINSASNNSCSNNSTSSVNGNNVNSEIKKTNVNISDNNKSGSKNDNKFEKKPNIRQDYRPNNIVDDKSSANNKNNEPVNNASTPTNFENKNKQAYQANKNNNAVNKIDSSKIDKKSEQINKDSGDNKS